MNDIKNVIRLKKIQADYVCMKKLCCNYLENIDHNSEYLMDNLWFGTYNLALANKKMGLFSSAYKLAKESMSYVINDGTFNSNYTASVWLVAESASEMGESFKEEAINLFDIVILAYKKIGEKRYSLINTFNKAKLMLNKDKMLECIRTYETTEVNGILPTHGDMKLDETLMEMKRCVNL